MIFPHRDAFGRPYQADGFIVGVTPTPLRAQQFLEDASGRSGEEGSIPTPPVVCDVHVSWDNEQVRTRSTSLSEFVLLVVVEQADVPRTFPLSRSHRTRWRRRRQRRGLAALALASSLLLGTVLTSPNHRTTKRVRACVVVRAIDLLVGLTLLGVACVFFLLTPLSPMQQAFNAALHVGWGIYHVLDRLLWVAPAAGVTIVVHDAVCRGRQVLKVWGNARR